MAAAFAADGGARRAPAGKDVLGDLQVGGRPRVFHLHVPPQAGRRPLPAVINLHGLGSNAEEQMGLTGMNAVADREGFFVLYPEGLGVAQSFNAGTCCGVALRDHVDDVAFVRAMLDRVARDYRVDPRRVFATGMSNGGFLAHRLACELSDRIAAVAPVAGLLGIPNCRPARPVSIFQFHGTADMLVQYGGGGLAAFPSVDEVMAGWARRDGCSGPRLTTEQHGDVVCESWAGCPQGVDVSLCRVEGGGHTWPGGSSVPRLGRTTTELSATERMWQFFQSHPK
jgi:polyhydroxybutyrate depolymerase